LTLAAFDFLAADPFAWGSDWAWGLPLIVLTVVIHVSGLAVVYQRVIQITHYIIERRHLNIVFIMVMGAATLLSTVLHGLEAGIWALAFLGLGALPNFKSAMLYSLNAMTSYGHTHISLEDHWHLMGALEALNGWLLFGLTTAFLFAVMQKVMRLANREEH
jgi:hypothetical protein